MTTTTTSSSNSYGSWTDVVHGLADLPEMERSELAKSRHVAHWPYWLGR